MITGLLVAAAETAPAEPSGTTQLVIAVLGAGSFGAILAAVITGVFSKKKLGAEATEIITKAASGVVENLNSEVIRVTAALEAQRVEGAAAEARHKVERAADRALHDRELEDIRRVLQLHVAWDLMAKAKLEQHGITLPEPPPLLPPLRRSLEE